MAIMKVSDNRATRKRNRMLLKREVSRLSNNSMFRSGSKGEKVVMSSENDSVNCHRIHSARKSH
uniref:Uncharacterized protein n=1 Tax=Onchocerca volvulus TaxID=6282 RepID=A0A8R1XTA1_ONCVO